MFTGIVTHIGEIKSVEERGDRRLVIATDMPLGDVAMGASIACSGACLTVVDKGSDDRGAWFAVDVSAETVSRTVDGRWDRGARLNLERALKMGDELGGHIVTGHVDTLAELVDITPDGDSERWTLAVDRAIGTMIAAKGSITLDGVSLTVNEVTDGAEATRFTVNLIPHTAERTTLGDVKAGDRVNLEVDVLARYLQRMTDSRV